MKLVRRSILALGIALALSPFANAQTFPNRPISVVVGAAAGGSNDIVARLVSERLSVRLGVPVIIENKPGASGFIAAGDVKNTAADGHRLLFAYTGLLAINPWLFKTLPYDPVKDFAPLSLIAKIPQVLLVRPQLGVSNVAELTAWLKAHSNEAAYGSAGVGTPLHIAGELFLQKAGVRAVHSPYKGSSPAYSDLLAGRIQFIFDSVPGTLPFIRSGQLIPLAITGTARQALLPNVPTLGEVGLPDAEVESWFGFVAPAGTPVSVTEKLSAALKEVMEEPDVRGRLEKLGAQPVGSSGSEMARFVAADSARWGRLIKNAGVQPE